MSNSGEQFGKYILLEKLASGGMAEVYLAKSTGASGVNKFVAIKRILPQYTDNAEFIEMFKEEAKITVNLNHGNVVSIYDFGIEKSQFFLVMEYMEGRNLRQILNEMKKTSTQFTVEQIVYIIKEVAAGLDHAHRCIDGTSGRPLNITHRDMSPQNIMVSFEGEVKIIDFGIAKAETQIEATKAGTLKGKFGYMSPEQADGQTIDLRTDVFSLGIVLWELLANDRLFTSNSEAAILRKIRECQIPSIRKINPSVSPELERIVNKALAKDKSLRYQTAAALHRDLNRFLNTEYPEFSPHDFSVFMKNAFSQAFLDQRKRLVEYSKLQGHPAANSKDAKGSEKTAVTQTDARNLTDSNYGNLRIPTPPKISGDNSAQDLDSEKLDIDTSTEWRVNLDNLKNDKSRSTKEGVRTTTTITNVTGTGHSGTATGVSRPAPHSTSRSARSDMLEALTVWTMRAVMILIASVSGWMLFKNADTLSPYWESVQKNLHELRMTQSQPRPDSSLSHNTPGQTDMAATAQYTVTIESEPSGARIWIDGVDTGSFTPHRRTVVGNKEFGLTLKKDRYLNYESTIRVNRNAFPVKATLQPVPRAASIAINLINGGANPVLKVNGQRLYEKLPIEKYVIPAGVAVTISAHNPFTGASAEQVVTVGENQKKIIELILK